ncbi:MAG: helicase [Firmicutes bacterium]|nr:helicase [Bacillota bacterium]
MDEELCRENGAGIFQLRFRIYQHFQEQHTEDETVKFLKEAFGTGGHSPFGDSKFWVDYDARGYRFGKGDRFVPEVDFRLSWKKVAKRIGELIAADRYLSAKDKDELYPQYLQYIEDQAILRQKSEFINATASLPPAEKRDSLSLRLADFINGLDGYLKEKLKQHGLSELADATNAGQIDALFKDPLKVDLLVAAMHTMEGAATVSFERYNARQFRVELEQLYPRRPVYHLGDTVYIGAHEYSVMAFDDSTVNLYDAEFPLLGTEMPRDEFDRKVAENPANEHLMTAIVEIQSESDVREQPIAVEETPRVLYKKYLPMLLEDIRQSEIYPFLRDRDTTAGEAEDEIGLFLNEADEREVYPGLLKAFGLPYFQDWMLEDILDRVYQDIAADRRDMLELHETDPDCPDWAKLPPLEEQVREELSLRGFAVSDELIAVAIEEHRADTSMDDVEDITDYIESKYLTEDPAPEPEMEPAPYTPAPGDRYNIDGRAFVVDEVNMVSERVSLRDMTFEGGSGFPIFRSESLDFMRQYDPIYEEAPEPEESKSTITPVWEQKKKPARANYFDAFPNIPMSERHNYRIIDDDLGGGGAKTKFYNNLTAINTLLGLEKEGRLATPEEQEVLSRYVGWGGLPQAFDEHRAGWEEEYAELAALLTPEEYASARATTLNAHYTSPLVIKAIYRAIENMGFTTGNILDPGCGIGNFQGLLPDNMSGSKVFGIEIDPITGRIAQQLYPRNSIAIQGYENTALPDSFFDLAVGNIPFGGYGVSDKKYDKYKFLIHDYFFAKTLDKVRPGGVIAFITSKGTLDKQNPAVRRYIAQRAELLGAIRLPNNAFLANAGTEVTTDIIFLQKRDRMVDVEPEWVHLGQTESGVPVNSYFVEHPDMVLGTMAYDKSMYGNEKETTCAPFPDRELSDLLDEAISNIHAEISDIERDEDEQETDGSIPADPSVRNFSFTVVEGQIYYRENSRMVPKELSATAQSRVKGLVAIRESVRRLISYQTEDYPDADIRAEQANLNRLYDGYTRKYGIINDRANNMAFSDDESYPLLCSLEVLDENLQFKAKADMFSKRTIRPYRPITHVDTASEALAVSIGECAKVDLDFMAGLTGMSADAIAAELEGVIFKVPRQDGGDNWVTADEYLSGNVREKLHFAKELAAIDPSYAPNVAALTAVQPKDLTAPEISVRLGATWIPPEIYRQFIFELLRTNWRGQNRIQVLYSTHTAEWNVTEKSLDRENIRSFNTYGTRRMNAYQIIEQTLNLRSVRVFDTVRDEHGNEKRVLNKKETAIAQDKQDIIKAQFAEWIWKDPARRDRLCELYNTRFNSIRPREYDGRHIHFPGMNPEIKLDAHQVNAVARHLYGGNALFGHVVGAGKSYEMIAAGMEAKRLGLCSKAMFVVPNNIIGDFAADFFKLYPSANVLMATAKDFEKKNRRKFCARIATGDYDGVIIAHSQFEKVPMSLERQRRSLEQQIWDITEGIEEIKRQNGERFTIKQMEKAVKSLQVKLSKLNDQSRKDSLVTFEELGVDALFVDEADLFKNLYLITKMRNVGGISQTESQKASDLFMKTRYLDELTGNRGAVFATGTPVSNTLAEVFTMQRYLQYDTLRKQGLQHFDCWSSTFGETVTALELTPEGRGFQMKTRFSSFYNLPELMSMFKEVADIQTKDMLNLPTPKVNYHTVVTKPSEMQREMIAGLADRAERIRNRMVSADEDNMLLITNDGRKIALDQRIINPLLPDYPDSKVNACAENVFRIWEETKENRLTQLVFSDLSTPHGDGAFNVYDDLKSKLIARGIPAEEIAFIHEAHNEAQKKEIVAKVRSGSIRVLMGSTSKMGAGMNAQDLLIASHDLDCPWRPRDLEQRAGRIERRGNKNPEVHIYRYVTEGTFDAYCYQIIENKQRGISQVFTSKSPARIMQEVDEVALNYAEIKALATGNPLIIERCSLEAEVNKLKTLKSSHLSQKYELENQIFKTYPADMKRLAERIAGYEHDISRAAEHPKPQGDGFVGMTVGGMRFDDKKEAGAAILEACKTMKNPDAVPLGEYRGFPMDLFFDTFGKEYRITLKDQLSHTVSLGTDVFGNITRLDNALEGMEPRLQKCREQLDAVKAQLETAKAEAQAPFPREQELAEKTARLAELTIALKLNEQDHEILDEAPDEGDEAAQPQRKSRDRGDAR